MMEKFKKLPFLKKIRLMYGVMMVIPILFLGGFLFYSSSSFVREKQRDEIEDTINRNVLEIRNRMHQCDSSLRYLASNYSFQEFLQLPKGKYKERNEMAKYIGPLIYNTLLSNQFFSKIQVYSSYDDAALSGLIKKDDDLVNESWYRETLGTEEVLWWIEEGKSFITRQIINYYPHRSLGIVRVDLKESMWWETFEIFDDITLKIDITDGKNIIYEYTNYEDEPKKEFKLTEEIPLSQWKIIYRVDKQNLSSYLHSRITLSMLIMAVLLMVMWFTVNHSSRMILKNLYRLIDNVRQVQNGNLKVQVDTSAQDEIGDLARSIEQMLKKINRLIDQIYKVELDKKDLELNLLQSKISPHFLYNNLSAINWIAIDKGEEQIYEITTQMAAFYRTALNKGINIDRLSVELENVKAYIKLQLLAHENSFEVEYDVDKTLLDYYVPIFIMQPLVENAIEHGIDQLREEKGVLEISVWKNEKDIILEIKDNGMELYTRMGTGVLSEESYGYGIGNVHKRVRLFCGDDYGVEVRTHAQGTTSVIRLKIDRIAMKW